jgi:anti-sigma factor ChrR (cupin superfamily)
MGHPADLAAFYLSGAMSEAERAAFEAHLAEGCVECDTELRALDEIAAALANTVEPVAPRGMTRVATLARANESLGELSPQQVEGVSALVAAVEENLDEVLQAAQDWEQLSAEGVFFHRLEVDQKQKRVVGLVRMEPGARFPPHSHDSAEQCVVLHGDLRLGQRRMVAGEYRYWRPGEPQPAQSTEEGCLLLVSSPID